MVQKICTPDGYRHYRHAIGCSHHTTTFEFSAHRTNIFSAQSPIFSYSSLSTTQCLFSYCGHNGQYQNRKREGNKNPVGKIETKSHSSLCGVRLGSVKLPHAERRSVRTSCVRSSVCFREASYHQIDHSGTNCETHSCALRVQEVLTHFQVCETEPIGNTHNFLDVLRTGSRLQGSHTSRSTRLPGEAE